MAHVDFGCHIREYPLLNERTMNIDDPTVLKRWRLVLGAFYFCASRRPFFSKESGSSVVDQVSNSTQVLLLYLTTSVFQPEKRSIETRKYHSQVEYMYSCTTHFQRTVLESVVDRYSAIGEEVARKERKGAVLDDMKKRKSLNRAHLRSDLRGVLLCRS